MLATGRMYYLIVALFGVVATEGGRQSSLSGGDVGRENLVEATIDSKVSFLCLYFALGCLYVCCSCGGFIGDSFVQHVEQRMEEDNVS
jgi:hypothetical protein